MRHRLVANVLKVSSVVCLVLIFDCWEGCVVGGSGCGLRVARLSRADSC